MVRYAAQRVLVPIDVVYSSTSVGHLCLVCIAHKRVVLRIILLCGGRCGKLVQTAV
jgi:hypothetical protein